MVETNGRAIGTRIVNYKNTVSKNRSFRPIITIGGRVLQKSTFLVLWCSWVYPKISFTVLL